MELAPRRATDLDTFEDFTRTNVLELSRDETIRTGVMEIWASRQAKMYFFNLTAVTNMPLIASAAQLREFYGNVLAEQGFAMESLKFNPAVQVEAI